jgi:hypothetical protein
MAVHASHLKVQVPTRTPADTPEPIDKEQTNALPRIESSIPSEEDVREGVYEKERLPHTRVVLLAALASLLVVGGVTLFITHPWDPNFFSTHATTAADTSQAGFPGTISKLQGQDAAASTTAATTGSDPVLASLSDAYSQLDTLRQEVDANEATFDEQATSSDLSARVSGKNEADDLALKVSNLVSTIDAIQVASTPYSETRENLLTLSNWLRNRVDPLCEAWALSVSSSDPTADESSIRAPMRRNLNSDGTNTYKALFSENYDSWKPVEQSS